ncbi:MAG: inositol monophosphatase family protein [Euzebya sp.]
MTADVTTAVTPSRDDLQAVRLSATRIAVDAGEVALSFLHRGVEWIEKNSRDLVSETDRLDRTVIAYALTSQAAEQWGGQAAMDSGVRALSRQALGTRIQGCSVADLTSVAMGRIDATVAGGMSKWDVAAGLLIVAEAGGVITSPAGDHTSGPAAAFVASPPGVHDAIRALLTVG